jgi:hypothetical protein
VVRGEHVIARVTPASLRCNRQMGSNMVLKRYWCILLKFSHPLKARLWTLLQLFIGACIANNVAWRYVSYNDSWPYELAGGVGVCVMNMVRGIMRCPEMRATGQHHRHEHLAMPCV